MGKPDDDVTQVRSPRIPPATTVASNATLFADYRPASSLGIDYEPPEIRRWPVVVALVLLTAIALAAIAAIALWAQSSSQPTSASRVPSPTPLPTPTPKPTVDRDLALREVMAVEERFHQAWIDGNREVMREVLADEFRNVSPLGRVQSKVDFVENARPMPLQITMSKASILTIRGTTITITLTKTYSIPGREPRSTLDTDTFVWREDRWQVTYSQSSFKP